MAAEGDFTGWKTYRSEKLRFEVKYPSEWEVLDNSPLGDYLDISLRDKEYDGSFEWPGLTIDAGYGGVEYENAQLSSIFQKDDAESGVVKIRFDKDSKRVFASCALYGVGEMIDTCNQILSTFKFIE